VSVACTSPTEFGADPAPADGCRGGEGVKSVADTSPATFRTDPADGCRGGETSVSVAAGMDSATNGAEQACGGRGGENVVRVACSNPATFPVPAFPTPLAIQPMGSLNGTQSIGWRIKVYPKPQTPNPKPSTQTLTLKRCNLQPLNPPFYSLNPSHPKLWTVNPEPSTLHGEPCTLNHGP